MQNRMKGAMKMQQSDYQSRDQSHEANMDVGKEFSSWESFNHSLEQYSKEHKVVYVVGTCMSVEAANKHESLQSKFPVKFKYCFARMLCKHDSNNSSRSNGLRPQQRTCKTGCPSSILISVNKKRTALVIKESNLRHTHEISETSFSRYTQNLRLQGEERRMASVLLRSGVALNQVQEFISSACSKVPIGKDVENIKASIKSTLSEREGHEYAFLSDLDQLMAEDPESVVEMFNFSVVPGAIYIQTSEMTKRMNSLQDGRLQIVTYDINDGKISIVSIIGLDGNLSSHILAFCIIIVDAEASFRHFLEAFVTVNPEFCDSLTGVVLDCPKDNADFLQQLIPQVSVAWSRSYILEQFTVEVKNCNKDIKKNMQLRKELMNSNSEEAYEKKLKDLFDTISPADSKEFLKTWDLCKELWAQYEISSHVGLQHQKSAVEMDFVKSLKIYVKTSMSLSELIQALLKLNRNEKPETTVIDKSFMSIDPSCEHYQQLCFPEASQAVICQLSIALSSLYEIKAQTDMIFVKKMDTGDEFMLDTLGSKCTCQFYLDTDLPCQHIFAWLHFSGKSLYSELLIPAKWQVFGKSITLDALAESLAQGYVPSSRLHDERLKELQTVLKDTLSSCCSHSYDQMGKDLILLKQVYNVMKNNFAHNATLLVSEEKKEPQHETQSESTPSVAPAPKKRGRPSKKPKLLQEMSLQPPEKGNSLPSQKTQMTTPVMRHNLRTNIKHKFVTRELRVTSEQISDTPNSSLEQKTTSEASKTVSVDQTEELHIIAPKYTTSIPSSEVSEDEALNDNTTKTLPVKNKVKRISKEVNGENNFANATVLSNLADGKPKAQARISAGATTRTGKPVAPSCTGVKRSHPENHNNNLASHEESSSSDEEEEEKCEDEDVITEEDNSDDETGSEILKKKHTRLETFLTELPEKLLNELLQSVSELESSEVNSESTKAETRAVSAGAADAMAKACHNKLEYVDIIKEHLNKFNSDYAEHAYHVAACVICQTFLTHVPIDDMLQSVRAWPGHLPDLPTSRCLEAEATLAVGQTLTVCGHKLNQLDMDTLRPDREISPKVLHAYLELLAQKHSGKVFVIPFDVIYDWRDGRFSQNIFRKVHLKTFEYLVLPIHCGAEFTEAERKSGDIVAPCWMALVADVKKKTVAVMNPRSEDKYIIAANGYMLQWRRYMQIRSVHTGEMLSSWTTTQIACSKIGKDPNSGILLIMNVEALINSVTPVVMSKAHIPNYLLYIAVALRDMDRETTVLCVGGPECQQLAARDADWLQCENCRTWWHQACSRHTDKRRPFYCSPCQQRITLVGGKTVMIECDDVEDEDEEDMQVEDVQKDNDKQEEGNSGVLSK